MAGLRGLVQKKIYGSGHSSLDEIVESADSWSDADTHPSVQRLRRDRVRNTAACGKAPRSGGHEKLSSEVVDSPIGELVARGSITVESPD